MTLRPLDVVVLTRDIPAEGLRKGDFGAVVEVYGPDAIAWSSLRHRAARRRWPLSNRLIFARSQTTIADRSAPWARSRLAAMPDRALEPAEHLEENASALRLKRSVGWHEAAPNQVRTP
jgi:Domain of unknown function (DUF4926)